MGRKPMDSEKFLVTIPGVLNEKMINYCNEVGLNRSELIRIAVIDYLSNRQSIEKVKGLDSKNR